MASKKFQKESEEWYMFMEFWKLCQAHWIPEKTEDYWQAVIDDCNKFYKSFKNVGFAKEMTLAFIEYLEKK